MLQKFYPVFNDVVKPEWKILIENLRETSSEEEGSPTCPHLPIPNILKRQPTPCDTCIESP